MLRYIPNTPEDQKKMLSAIGIDSIDELFSDIPDELRLKRDMDIPVSLSEQELTAHMKAMASKNAHAGNHTCFLGAGIYDHYIPSVVKHMVSRSEFYTAYTPYQPELSQGMLQAIFEYQTMICSLTGLDVSNASMYDGATALAETALMAVRQTGRSRVLVSRGLHPEYREVLNTYASFIGFEVVEVGVSDGTTCMDELERQLSGGGSVSGDSTGSSYANGGPAIGSSVSGCPVSGNKASSDLDACAAATIILQNPNFFGAIEDMKTATELAHKNGALSIACTDPISLSILQPPGEYDADIAAGDGQSLGNQMNFGGPHLGFLAAKKELVRKIPGRIVGQTNDYDGRRGYVLTLQAREQHIRREKAVSNICSNQALNALTATVYLSVMGKQGLKEAANLCLNKAHYACNSLLATGRFEKVNSAPFFKEFVIRALDEPIDAINKRLLENGIIGGLELERFYPEMKGCWLVAVTEKRTKQEIDALVEIAAGGGR